MAEQNKGIKISDLPQSVTFTGLWTLGYQVVNGMAVSVKVSLEDIQAAYEGVKSATADARQAVTDGEALRIDLLAAESMRAASEAARQQAENLRGEDEDVRKAAEEDRKSNESARQSQESQRSDAESARQSNETTREENEQARISAEEQRAASEAARGEAEAVRESNEATRLSNETARGTAESTRVATEIEREANELTRKSNESNRQAQEAERQANTATAITNAETATASANTAAQNAIKAKQDTEAATALATELNDHPWIIRQGVWYKWNTETDQYESTGLQAKGDTGASFTIVGIYPTVDDLKAAVPDGTDVDGVYAVGTGDPYDYYAWVYQNDAWQWVNQGQLRGPEGKSAYEVWLTQGNEGKSESDYFAYLQQPATEAAETANQAAEAANQAKEAADQAEALRAASETAREQAESSRQAAEIAREQAESSRQSAETAREQAESDRGEAEDLRQTNEDARIAAELTRKANEEARQSAETARRTAEDNRTTAEAARVAEENKRSESEKLRAESEIMRQQAEATRAANESNREASETERQTNELKRQSDTATAISNANQATSAANEAAAKATDAAIAAKTGTVGIMLDAEPTEDTLTYMVGEVTHNFELGMLAICQDPSADNGRSVYLFKGKTDDGKAIWWKTGSIYQHPSHTAHESGLYKITTDGLGHVSDATAVTKADITGLGIPAQDTTYSAGSGLSLSGTTINHASSITAGTAGTSSSTSGSNTISIPYVTYNNTGHVTEAGTRTHTINAATTSESGLMSSSDKTKMNRLESYTTATTVASLDVNYQTIYVTLSANASLSASNTGAAYNGRSITAYVYTSSSVTITIPTSGDYVSMCGSSFTTTAGGWVEFSLVCVNGVWHIAKLEAE